MTRLFWDVERKEVAIRKEFFISGFYIESPLLSPLNPNSCVIPKRQRGILLILLDFDQLSFPLTSILLFHAKAPARNPLD
jgi:hypothetical protein